MSKHTLFTSDMAEVVERVRPSVVQVVQGRRGAGAGIIWRANGAVLTNHHVVARADRAEVILTDGREFEADVVNRAPALDLALLRVEADDLPAALVDDSSTLRVGEWVFAIGHPWGERDVVTAGIVSGIGSVRVGRDGQRARYLRSDVRLAPGNSGGPLLNARGAVVGINAMIFGGDLAVSIPSQVARAWVAGLPSRRVTLGIGVAPVELPEALRRDARAAGLLVTEVPHQSAAPALLVGDVLLDVEGDPVTDADTLAHLLGHRRTGERVRLNVMRGGAVRALEVDVGALEQTL